MDVMTTDLIWIGLSIVGACAVGGAIWLAWDYAWKDGYDSALEQFNSEFQRVFDRDVAQGSVNNLQHYRTQRNRSCGHTTNEGA